MSHRTPTAIVRAGFLAGIATAALLRVLAPTPAEALLLPAVQAREPAVVENMTGLDARGLPDLLGTSAPERRSACDSRRRSKAFDPRVSMPSDAMNPPAPRSACAAPGAVHERSWR